MRVEIEILGLDNPLAPPPREGIVSPTLLDSLLAMLPERHEEEEPVAPIATTEFSEPDTLIDLGFVEAEVAEAAEPKRDLQAPTRERPKRRNVQERVRALTPAEQQMLARRGEQPERVALERMLGKTVWESLLRNPKLSPPEAARIARKATLPIPLLELIVSNRGWLSSPQVRRALLANRRLAKDLVMTVLRATPRSELKLMPKQMGYPSAVRDAAAKLLK